MTSANSFPSTLRFKTSDAQDILLAEILETSKISEEKWTEAESQAATRDTKNILGENFSQKDFLASRARLVLTRMRCLFPKEASVSHLSFNTLPFTAFLGLTAFLAGALSDRFAMDGARINLLAPPILLLLLWNLCLYLTVLLRTLGLKTPGSAQFSPVVLLSRLFSRFKWKGLHNSAPKALFVSRVTALFQPLLIAEAKRAFHLAAVGFALGLLTSIAVRGIGTAYVVGWESTWFAGTPELIAKILQSVYGLVPLNFFGIDSFPDINEISALRFDRLNVSGTFADPAPWLLRLMSSLCIIVIIPRLLLTIPLTFGINFKKKFVDLPVDSAYYRSVFKSCSPSLQKRILFVDHNGKADNLSQEWLRFSEKSGNTEIRTFSVWDNDLREHLKKYSSKSEFLLGIDAGGTPEEEVHGNAFSELRNYPDKESSCLPVVVLNLSKLIKKYGPAHNTVGSKRALWEDFAHSHGLPIVCADLSSEEELLKTISTVRELSDGANHKMR